MSKFFENNDIIDSSSSFFSSEDITEQLTPEQEELGLLTAAGLGAARDVSLGFSDEIAGAVSALSSLPQTGLDKKQLLDQYRQTRDKVRALTEQAEQESPVATNLGGLAASVATLPFTGLVGAGAKGLSLGQRIASGAKFGAATGAISGVGQSKSDNVADIARESFFGAGIGAGFGGAIPLAPMALSGAKTLGKAIASPITTSRPVQNISNAAKAAFENKNLVTKAGAEQASDEVLKLGEKTSKLVGDTLKDLSEKKQVAFDLAEKEGRTVDISARLSELTSPNNKDLIPFTSDGRIKDIKKLTQKAEAIRLELGLNPLEKRAYEALNDELKPLMTKFKANKLNNEELDSFNFISSSLDDLNQLANARNANLSPKNADKVRKVLQDLEDLPLDPKNAPLATDEARAISKATRKTLIGDIKNAAGTTELDAQIGGIKNKLEIAGLEDLRYIPEESLFESKDIADISKKIARSFEQGDRSTVSAASERKRLSEILDSVRNLKPKEVSELETQGKKATEYLDTAKYFENISVLNPMTLAGAGANIAGKIARVPKAIVETSKPKIATVANTLYDNSGETLRRTADSLKDKSDSVSLYLRKKLYDAAEEPSEQRRRAITNSLMQNPAYRKYFIKDTQQEEEN